MKKSLLLLCSISSIAVAVEAPLWRDVDERLLQGRNVERPIRPRAFRTLTLHAGRLDELLRAAPLEQPGRAALGTNAAVISLPMPAGGYARFAIEESPVMEPVLAAKFPEIRTFRGQGLDDPAATVRLDETPLGFHAMILSEKGTYYIDPYQRGDTATYMTYDRRDLPRDPADTFTCGVTETSPLHSLSRGALVSSGTSLRTFRLAMAATSGYTTFFGGVGPAISAIVTTVNRVTGIYEKELAIKLVLVGNNNSIVYGSTGSDPYYSQVTQGYLLGGALLNQNQTNLDNVIGSGNYDIGHVVHNAGGGLASVGVVCSSNKARGYTGKSNPVGDGFDVDYVAHEVGHQFSAAHPFNGSTDACGDGNRDATAAYEPGSGSTIMAYAGICGAENLQSTSDPYFHAKNHEQIQTFVSSIACAQQGATGNQPPTVSAGADATIPQGTPFQLTAAGSDPNGDALTYGWEEYDLGTQSPPDTDDGSRPLFRSLTPTSSSTRVFPKMSSVLAGTTTYGEKLPATTRAMTFRVTARDNRAGGGGVNSDSAVVNVVGSAGPFTVTAPVINTTWTAGQFQAVSWNVANTASAPVSCANVTISLSTDGGSTFTHTLAASAPNSGTASVVAPSVSTGQARVRVACASSVFFGVNPANFTIGGGGGSGCVPGSQSLCLNASRFRLQVAWRNPYDGGTTGVGTAVPLTSDTGYFWFFNSANVELVVKVLDGRAVNGKFWVFYGALTDVEYSITVTDTSTSALKTYFNPGQTLGSVADINAF